MSFEIELKAHVYNRENVIAKMNGSGAKYLGHTEKSDTYYRFPLNNKKYISARIRKEELTMNGKSSAQNYFTYKRKESLKDKDGNLIEVNDENEFTFEGDTKALEVFFNDLGAIVSLNKSKSVEQWTIDLDGETAHVELCSVPPLGDFLEIEIIKDNNDSATVERCKKIEEKIFLLCNIPLSDLEPRYYRDMLAELK